MQINIGDKVRFLNDVGGGTVCKLIDANTVLVLNEDEFEIPCLKTDLVVVEAADGKSAQAKEDNKLNTDSKPIQSHQERLWVEKEDVSIAFAPREDQNPTDSPLELYLINDTNSILLYTFYDQKGEQLSGQTAGNLDPKSKILLCEYDRKELNELSNCFFQILYYSAGLTEIKKPLEKNIKIQAVKFHKLSSYKSSAYFRQNVVLYQLTADKMEEKLEELSQKEFKKVIREKEASTKAKKSSLKLSSKDDILEIDLHINALIDSITGLSNADILEFQLKKFHEVMRENQNRKGKKIVFIHGIGNGTLKKKLHDELRRKYKKHYQQDASFKEYGWGATMVTIR